MSIFILESDEVGSISSSIDGLASEISALSSSVSSFDVTCDDFDFESAKQAIASNLDACYQKVKNTSLFMTEVVTSHTSLQTSMTTSQNQPEETQNQEETQNRQSSRGSSSNYGGSYSGGYRGSSSPNYNDSYGSVSVGTTIIPTITIEPEGIDELAQKATIIALTLATLEKIDPEMYKELLSKVEGTEWCNELINLCAKENGFENNNVIPKFTTADEGLKWFQSQELFKKDDYSPTKGDLVFLDTDNDKVADRVAIVTEIKDNKIYTLEGNDKEKLTKASYELTNSSILGYGTPRYEELTKSKKKKQNDNVI